MRDKDYGDEHECTDSLEVDVDICSECGEHAGFCSICGTSSCCNAKPVHLD